MVRVSLVRTGGFAGLRTAGEVDTAGLPDAEAAEVTSLVEQLLAALDTPGARSPGADRFQYELTISDAGGLRRLSVTEADLGAEARGLLARLEKRARPAGTA